MAKVPLYRSLYAQVLAGITLGIVVGLVAPETGAAMRPLGDGFIKLIRMLIGPIVFTTIVVGLAHVGEMRPFSGSLPSLHRRRDPPRSRDIVFPSRLCRD